MEEKKNKAEGVERAVAIRVQREKKSASMGRRVTEATSNGGGCQSGPTENDMLRAVSVY